MPAQLNLAQEVLAALKPLKNLAGKESDCADVEKAVAKPVSNWKELETIKELGKKFQRRGKNQERQAKDQCEKNSTDGFQG